MCEDVLRWVCLHISWSPWQLGEANAVALDNRSLLRDCQALALEISTLKQKQKHHLFKIILMSRTGEEINIQKFSTHFFCAFAVIFQFSDI